MGKAGEAAETMRGWHLGLQPLPSFFSRQPLSVRDSLLTPNKKKGRGLAGARDNMP